MRDLHTGAVLDTIFFGPHTGDTNIDDVVQSLTIDPFTHQLYVSDWGSDAASTGIRQFNYDPVPTSGTHGQLTPVATNGGFLFTAVQTESSPGNVATTRFTSAQDLQLDTVNHLLYYTDDDSGFSGGDFHSTNAVYVVSTNGPTFSPIQLTTTANITGGFPPAVSNGGVGVNGSLVGIAVDVTHGIVFFESTNTANDPDNGLWWVNTTTPNQTAHKITLPPGVTLNFAGQSSPGGDAAGLTFDPLTNQLYVTNAYTSGDVNQHNFGSIIVLQVNATAGNVSGVTLVQTIDVATLVGDPPPRSMHSTRPAHDIRRSAHPHGDRHHHPCGRAGANVTC